MSGSHDDYRDRPEGAPRTDEELIRTAKGAVFVPAVGLIGIGVFTIFFAALGLIQLPGLPGKFDEIIKQIENDPNIPAADKKQFADLLTKVRDFFVAYGAMLYGGTALVGAIVLVGGIRYMSLNNPALVVLSALGSMLPLTLCCFPGLVFGIWALVALLSPSVKAGFAARRRAGYFPDAPQG
jgi:hypothetical protein